MIKAGQIYKHFKGAEYYIRGIAEHTETGEAIVVYSKKVNTFFGKAKADTKIYARPMAMFVSKVDKETYPLATQEYRFELVEG